MSFKLDIVVDFTLGGSSAPIQVPACKALKSSGVTALVLLPKGFTPPTLTLAPPLRLISQTQTEADRGVTALLYVLYVPSTVSEGQSFKYSFETSDKRILQEPRSANGTIDVSAGNGDPPA
ncbi:hypothetical protein [Corallococcus sp. 4LFB]|uniref:hypothetical protein n=1 Tax=Corallococcus sp. 4LFB TaxID=3383249 RepID=UPI0039770E32